MTYTLVEVGLSRFSCDACGVVFAIPTHYYERWKEGDITANKCRVIICPICGHNWTCGDTKSQRLEKQLVAKQACLDQVLADRSYKEKQLQVRKGLLTRFKNRVGRGVCPCCNRFFEQLGRHMTTQHPEFKDSKS